MISDSDEKRFREVFKKDFGDFALRYVERTEPPENRAWSIHSIVWDNYLKSFRDQKLTMEQKVYSPYLGSNCKIIVEFNNNCIIELSPSYIQITPFNLDVLKMVLQTTGVGGSYNRSNRTCNFKDAPIHSQYFRRILYNILFQHREHIVDINYINLKRTKEENTRDPFIWHKEKDIDVDEWKEQEHYNLILQLAPNDIRKKIASMSAKTLLTLSMTGNRMFFALEANPYTWKYLVERDFPQDFEYFHGELPVMMQPEIYLLQGRDYDNEYKNNWKRWYLQLRESYGFTICKKQQVATKEEHIDRIDYYADNPRARIEYVETLLFTDESISRFIRYLFREIAFVFMEFSPQNGPASEQLALYCMNNPEGTITDYRNTEKEKREKFPRYNAFIDALLMKMDLPYPVGKFKMSPYKDDWLKFVEKDDVIFFDRVSRAFDGRIYFIIGDKKTLLIDSIVYGDQIHQETIFTSIRQNEAFDWDQVTWDELAEEATDMNFRKIVLFSYAIFQRFNQNQLYNVLYRLWKTNSRDLRDKTGKLILNKI